MVVRWFVYGLLAGAAGGVVWGLFIHWLNRTEDGRTFCRAVAYQWHPEQFRGREVDLREVEGVGQPEAAALGLGLVALPLWGALYLLARRWYRAGSAGLQPADAPRCRRIAWAAAVIGSIPPLLVPAIFLGQL